MPVGSPVEDVTDVTAGKDSTIAASTKPDETIANLADEENELKEN